MVTTRQKYKNLLRNPVASLFLLDPANPFRTLEIRADVTLTPDPDKELLPLFAKYYVGGPNADRERRDAEAG
jgi:hypothetical protein